MYTSDKDEFNKVYLIDEGIKIYEELISNISFSQDRGVKRMESLINEHNTLWLSIGINGLSYVRSIEKEGNVEVFLKALSDPTRLRIMTMLASKKNYVQSVANELKLAPSTIYHHLDTLNTLSLVTSEKVGKKVYYKVNRDEVLLGIKSLSSVLIGGQYEL